MNEQIYVDVYGRRHAVSKKLSSGGQGVVYRTEEPDVLLKLEWKDPLKEIIENNTQNNERFKYIRALPLREGTNLTLPQAILKDYVGYTMKMLDGMVSFEDAFHGEGYPLPENDWLSSVSRDNEDFGNTLKRYIATGGIRKRLHAFLNASCILSDIHAGGLVYCDISDKNMFVSSDPDYAVVWLIDCDNLCFMSEAVSRNDEGLHTPGYGAPEIYTSKGKTMYSDVYSFAIALFWKLTGGHPFVGDAVMEDMDMEDMSNGEFACAGNYSWICDEEDDSNYSSEGLPAEYLVSRPLLERFQRTFGTQGRKNKQKRTTMPEWSYILARELDHTVRCKCCGMDYYANENTVCPWCDTDDNRILKITSYRIIGDKRLQLWDYVHEINADRINPPLRLLEGFIGKNKDEKAFSVSFDKANVIISELSNKYDFFTDENMGEKLFGNMEFSAAEKIRLYATDKNNKYLLLIEGQKCI